MLEIAQVVRIVLLVLLVGIAISNLFSLRRVESFRNAGSGCSEQEQLPFVSVLVPARNEEANIENCLRSLLAQNYPRFELLVLDDCSTDQTPVILRRLSQSDKVLRVLSGKPLPEGWLGKHWACHQLTQVAHGDYLLFTDADTEHHPDMLRDAVRASLTTQADLLTGIPREITVTWGERLVVPVIGWAVCSLLPFGLAHRLRSPLLCLGVGQFMLFRRKAFESVGGFAAIRQDPVDDVALARRLKAAGHKWRFVDLTERVSCRMYTSLETAIDGLGKSVFPVLGYRLWLLVLVLAALAWMFLAPVCVLVGWLLGFEISTQTLLLNALAVALSLSSWEIAMRRLGYPWYQALLFPAVISTVMYLASRSAVKFQRGEAQWKGRTLPCGDLSSLDEDGHAESRHP